MKGAGDVLCELVPPFSIEILEFLEKKPCLHQVIVINKYLVFHLLRPHEHIEHSLGVQNQL